MIIFTKTHLSKMFLHLSNILSMNVKNLILIQISIKHVVALILIPDTHFSLAIGENSLSSDHEYHQIHFVSKIFDFRKILKILEKKCKNWKIYFCFI